MSTAGVYDLQEHPAYVPLGLCCSPLRTIGLGHVLSTFIDFSPDNSTVSISLTDNGTKLRHNYNGRLLGGPTSLK